MSLSYERLTRLEADRVKIARGPGANSSQWSRLHPTRTMGRDRFNDIFVWKTNRVNLNVPDGQNDYVNASPIQLTSAINGRETRYIAMQAPKKETTDHVWRMIWHEVASPGVIVTLTTDNVHPYFPLSVGEVMAVNEDDEFGDGFHGSVTCESLENSSDGATEIRKLVMRVPAEGKGEQKIFWNLLYSKWPDYGIPSQQEKESLLNVIELSRRLNKGPLNPRVVHCRAGVGRSGSFMALDFLLKELENDHFRAEDWPRPSSNGGVASGSKTPKEDPIFEIVNRLREQRPLSVQTLSQYKFLYEMLRECWEKKYRTRLPVRARSVGDEKDVFTD